MKLISRIIKPVYAHCDVPCGIYETDTMVHAADTCIRMDEKIADLGDPSNAESRNNFVRMVMTKEKHAQLCKEQILILWTDFFKPEHHGKYPQLHDVVWKAAKQCSKVKQGVDVSEARLLAEQVSQIASIFKEVKG